MNRKFLTACFRPSSLIGVAGASLLMALADHIPENAHNAAIWEPLLRWLHLLIAVLGPVAIFCVVVFVGLKLHRRQREQRREARLPGSK